MRKAFTLIELLLAITLLVVVAGVSYTCFTAATSAWRVGTETADEITHADYILEQISMGLRSAYYPDSANPAGAYGFVVTDGGEGVDARDKVSWVKLGTSLVGADSPIAGTPHRVELYIADESEAASQGLPAPGLALRAWRLVAQLEDFDAYDNEVVRPLLLTPQVIGMDILPLDPKNNLEEGHGLQPDEDDELKWMQDEWKDDYTNRLPYAVQVALYLPPAQGKKEPLEVKRVVVLPTAPLSWRDKGAAGGSAETGGGNRNDRRNRQGESIRGTGNDRRNRQEELGRKNGNGQGERRRQGEGSQKRNTP